MGTKPEQTSPLRKSVHTAVRRYFKDMGSTQPEDLHQLVLSEVEPPLIEEVLAQTGGNQSTTAKILGITRNTLRTKLKRYKIRVNGKSR